MDKIEKINKSTIQHGKDSDRIYLMKLDPEDYSTIANKLDQIAASHRYSKIFIKIPDPAREFFDKEKYIVEAEVPFFYNGKEKGLFMAKYLNPSRLKLDEDIREQIIKNIRIAKTQQVIPFIEKPEGFDFRLLTKEDAVILAKLYKDVFQSYPFPIQTPDYIIKTMDDNIVYFGAFKDGKLVAAASSEMYVDYENVEMTDFATLPKFRGNKLALYLLSMMEPEMKKRGMKTLYTIARSYSAGMNITFARNGYKFAGTLINNTNIAGAIESMNVWYK
ncbi:MAG: putative beta-lysine N-acetyltransferase [Fidelibacterota bacterium]